MISAKEWPISKECKLTTCHLKYGRNDDIGFNIFRVQTNDQVSDLFSLPQRSNKLEHNGCDKIKLSLEPIFILRRMEKKIWY